MSMKKVKVVWKGNLKEGRGRIEFANGASNQEYTFASRFGMPGFVATGIGSAYRRAGDG